MGEVTTGRITIQRPMLVRNGGRKHVEVEILGPNNDFIAKAWVEPEAFLAALMGGSSVVVEVTQDAEEAYQ